MNNNARAVQFDAGKGVRLLRENTRARIIACLRTRGPLSKAHLARMTGLSLACISTACRQLLSEGVLAEAATVAGPRGRPLVLLTINPNGAPVAGVRLAPESIEIAVAGPTLDILSRRTISFGTVGHDVTSVVGAIADGIARCAESAGKAVEDLGGVGLVMHGVRVNPVLGTIEDTTYLPEWEDVPITDLLEERLHLPVVADNCVRAGALAHQWFASGGREGRTYYLIVAEGIGGALLDGHDPVQDIHHSGNLIGHTIIDPSGPRCPCGKKGCLEMFVSDQTLIGKVWPEQAANASDMLAVEREGMVRQAYEMARAGHPAADSAYKTFVNYLAMGISNAITLFAPRAVVVAGTLIDIDPTSVIEDVRREVLRLVDKRDSGIEIGAALDYKEFVLRGALGLVVYQPFRDLRNEGLLLRGWQTPPKHKFRCEEP